MEEIYEFEEIQLTANHIVDYITDLKYCVGSTTVDGNLMQMYYHPASQELDIYRNFKWIATFDFPDQVKKAVDYYNDGGCK